MATDPSKATGGIWVRFSVTMSLLFVGLVLGGVWVLEAAPGGATWLRLALAAVAAAPMLVLLGRGRRLMLALEGIESSIYLRATSLAFFVTVVASLVYGLLEAFAGAPRPSALWAYVLAMGTWGLATAWLSWRVSA